MIRGFPCPMTVRRPTGLVLEYALGDEGVDRSGLGRDADGDIALVCEQRFERVFAPRVLPQHVRYRALIGATARPAADADVGARPLLLASPFG